MNQEIEATHRTDENGMPAGGETLGKGIRIEWQNGPLGPPDGPRNAPNGAFVEGVIAAARDRLCWYQSTNGGRFFCDENHDAIEHLSIALDRLNDRTRRRERANVEGTHAKEGA